MNLRMLLFPLATAAATAAHAGVTTDTITYHSAALDRPTTYIAALPSPLKPDHKYPVLYLLHGAYDNYRAWTDRTTLTQELAGRDLIVIMPDGSEFGWYLDSKIDPANQYDSAISRDLVRDVESRYPVRTDRGGRAIAGLSMGGHGALSLAAKHPELYSSASSLSGILNVSAHPGKWKLDEILGEQPATLDEWRRHSVLHLADTFTTANVALLFDTGLGDETGAVKDNQDLHHRLQDLNVPHIYREYPGTHNWEYWSTHIKEHLDFHQENFTNGTGSTLKE